ncbi:hypothetical protein [Marinobacter sp. V034]|uniref:hypothetical protein n=1 Tax=Marinobacter sp. V034 TaxID=3459610 RepID=UPI0040439664
MRFIVFLTLLISSFAFADDAYEVQALFNKYVEFGKNFDADVVELYSPDARISTLRDGRDTLEFTGAEWQTLVRKIMPVAERRGDVSTYTDVQVDSHGEGYRVTALRSSALKCIDGLDFHMDVEREGDRWLIVEEYTETASLSQCEPSDELAESLSKISNMIRPHLPLNLDADTRLESVEVEGSALIYSQRLHTTTASELDLDEVQVILNQIGVQSACGDPRVSSLIDNGATIRYATVDREGERLGTVDVSPGVCSALRQ